MIYVSYRLKVLAFFKELKVDEAQEIMVSRLVQEITSRLTFLCDVGLDYLSLNRTARTFQVEKGSVYVWQLRSVQLSVGYYIFLMSRVLDSISGIMIVLLKTLHRLRDLGNTVVVVEHDTDTMMSSDYIIDMGPAAGIHGGSIVAVGKPEEIAANELSLTGAYLSGRRAIQTA